MGKCAEIFEFLRSKKKKRNGEILGGKRICNRKKIGIILRIKEPYTWANGR